MTRRNRIILFTLVVIIIVGLIIAAVIGVNKSASQNQFGGYIKIQNYDEKIKRISSDVKDSVQSSLYNTVKKNSPDVFNPATVTDAFIRDTTDSQNFDTTTQVYNGSFIVDMASIKQSYQVQYSYSTSNTIDTGGSPVVVSCLSSDKLQYGDFSCKDLVTQQARPNDSILQYLPYQNFSFKISPDSTSGELVLNVTLSISDSDYGTSPASHADAVAAYKGEVINWFTKKTLDPSKYTIKYNYTNAGDYLGSSTYQ